VMILLSFLFLAISVNRGIARLDAGMLLGAFVVYMLYVGRGARQELEESTDILGEGDLLGGLSANGYRPLRDLALTLAGTIALVVGARLLVDSASSIARAVGVSEVVIGLTLVAFGTSVPELAASVVASIRGEAQIVLGNIVGSNIFNVTLIIGTAALIRPLPIHESVLRFDAPIMIGISVLLLLLAVTNLRVTRLEGGILLTTYCGFLFWVIA
jgi:cation:H+ antiporter